MQSGQFLTLGIWRAMWNASHFVDLYLGELAPIKPLKGYTWNKF